MVKCQLSKKYSSWPAPAHDQELHNTSDFCQMPNKRTPRKMDRCHGGALRLRFDSPYLDNNYKRRAAETFDVNFLPGAHPKLPKVSDTVTFPNS
jgi:hypothetical protein